MVPSEGSPAYVLAKGPPVQFISGSPLTFQGPKLPGYEAFPGRGLFMAGRYNCTGTLR